MRSGEDAQQPKASLIAEQAKQVAGFSHIHEYTCVDVKWQGVQAQSPKPEAQSQKPTIITRVLNGSMLALGFLHGLGADHLMAIAALSLATPLGPARYGRAF